MERIVRFENGTASNSRSINRRARYPRNASSSAIGTVSAAAPTRNAIHVRRAITERPASAVPNGLAKGAFTQRAGVIHTRKIAAPVNGANQPKRQFSFRNSARKNQRPTAAAIKRNGYSHSKYPEAALETNDA